MHTGKSDRTFREKNRAITDVRLFAGSNKGLIAGYETQGTVFRSPIPGKVKILTSDDLENWTEMPVDYRAVAHSAIIAGPDDSHVWVATDTGMILKLVMSSRKSGTLANLPAAILRGAASAESLPAPAG